MENKEYFLLKQSLRDIFQNSIKLKDDIGNKAPENKLKIFNKILDNCDKALHLESNESLSDEELAFFKQTKTSAESITRSILIEIGCIKVLKSNYMQDINKQLNLYKAAVNTFSSSGEKGFYDIAVTVSNNTDSNIEHNKTFNKILQSLILKKKDIIIFNVKKDQNNKAKERTILMANSSFYDFCNDIYDVFSKEGDNVEPFLINSYYLLPNSSKEHIDIDKTKRLTQEYLNQNITLYVEKGLSTIGYLRTHIPTDFKKSPDENLVLMDKAIIFTLDQMGHFHSIDYQTKGISRSPFIISNSTLNAIRDGKIGGNIKVPFNIRTHLEYLKWKEKSSQQSHT